MKGALVSVAALVFVLGALSVARGGWALLVEGLRAGGRGAVLLAPLLMLVLMLTGLIEALLPRDTVTAWLADSAGSRGILLAWLAGALTPGGGPIGLSLAAALLRAGAGTGVLVTYLSSLSLLSFVRIPLEVGIYGGRLTALRFLGGLLLPPLAGVIAQTLGRLLG